VINIKTFEGGTEWRVPERTATRVHSGVSAAIGRGSARSAVLALHAGFFEPIVGIGH
jgi:hypothetical protein